MVPVQGASVPVATRLVSVLRLGATELGNRAKCRILLEVCCVVRSNLVCAGRMLAMVIVQSRFRSAILSFLIAWASGLYDYVGLSVLLILMTEAVVHGRGSRVPLRLLTWNLQARLSAEFAAIGGGSGLAVGTWIRVLLGC